MQTQIETPQFGSRKRLRVELFSDAVFAIAITILVLQPLEALHLAGKGGVLQFCLHHWESFLSYFVGFCTVLICWINHHHIFSYINKVDVKLMWLNGLMLLVLAFTPVPTAVLSMHLENEGSLVVAIFGFNYVVMAIATYGMSAYAYNHYFVEHKSRELFHGIKLTYGYAVLYIIAVSFVCFISAPAAVVLYALLFGIFAFPKEAALKVLKMKKSRQRKLMSRELNAKPAV